MRIGIMLRTLDEKGGVGVYSRNLVGALLELDRRHQYELYYRSSLHLGLHAGRVNVREHVVPARSKAAWDQVAIPRATRMDHLDVLLHPKFTLPLLSQVPSVMVVHGADWFLPDAAQFYSRLDRAYMRVFMPLYLRKAASVISVSQLTTDDFARIFPRVAEKIHTVYFGPAPHFVRVTDAERLAEVRRRYGLPDHYILTLTKVGGEGRKNLAGILRGFERLHGTVPHKLVIGGLGCERFRRDYGLPDTGWGRDVLFPGYLDQLDLPAIYSASDLFLYPSNQEAFPIPLTEAMACGVPIVTSHVNGLREIAGDAAVLVDPSDAAEIADGAARVLTDSALRQTLGAAGLERSRMFSWRRCAERTLEILEQAAVRPSSRALAGRAA